MPFEIIRQEITKMNVNVIVNFTSSYPEIGLGVERMIHEEAGPDLLVDRKMFGFLDPTEAIITKGYNLLSRQVIHVVGPVFKDGNQNETELLYKTYINALKLADQYNVNSIAIPLISSKTLGFPRDQVLEIALKAIKEFLSKSEMMIYLVVYDERSYQISVDKFDSIKTYIANEQLKQKEYERSSFLMEKIQYNISVPLKKSKKLKDMVNHLEDSFVESLFNLIDERGLDDVSVYKKANIDRKLFSKMKSNLEYQPSKITAIAFAIALELNIDETKDLLAKAGFALSKSSKFDLIIQYFIENEIYDLYEVNQVLFAFNQKTIGALD